MRWNSVECFETFFRTFATVYVETPCDHLLFYLSCSKCTFNKLFSAISDFSSSKIPLGKLMKVCYKFIVCH